MLYFMAKKTDHVVKKVVMFGYAICSEINVVFSICICFLALHFRLEGIEERKRDRVWLHITVTLPTKYAGRRMTLKTQRVFPRCFKKAVEYLIFTNRWIDSLPEISRITGSDVIVQKDKLSSFKCTIDCRVKAS